MHGNQSRFKYEEIIPVTLEQLCSLSRRLSKGQTSERNKLLICVKNNQGIKVEAVEGLTSASYDTGVRTFHDPAKVSRICWKGLSNKEWLSAAQADSGEWSLLYQGNARTTNRLYPVLAEVVPAVNPAVSISFRLKTVAGNLALSEKKLTQDYITDWATTLRDYPPEEALARFPHQLREYLEDMPPKLFENGIAVLKHWYAHQT